MPILLLCYMLCYSKMVIIIIIIEEKNVYLLYFMFYVCERQNHFNSI